MERHGPDLGGSRGPVSQASHPNTERCLFNNGYAKDLWRFDRAIKKVSKFSHEMEGRKHVNTPQVP